jgi:hypothetical protein
VLTLKYSVRTERRAGGKQPPVDLDPDPLLLVNERIAVVISCAISGRPLKGVGIAKSRKDSFHSGKISFRYEKIDIAHEPEMRKRIVLLSDRNAFEKSNGLDPPLARVQDFSHCLEVFGDQDLSGQICSTEERPKR